MLTVVPMEVVTSFNPLTVWSDEWALLKQHNHSQYPIGHAMVDYTKCWRYASHADWLKDEDAQLTIPTSPDAASSALQHTSRVPWHSA